MGKKAKLIILIIGLFLTISLSAVEVLYSFNIIDGWGPSNNSETSEGEGEGEGEGEEYPPVDEGDYWTVHLHWANGTTEDYKYEINTQEFDLSTRITVAERVQKMFFDGWYKDAAYTQPFSNTEVRDGIHLYAKCSDAVIIKLYGLDPNSPFVSSSQKVRKNISFNVNDYINVTDRIVFGTFTSQRYNTSTPDTFYATEDKDIYVRYATPQGRFNFSVADGKATIISANFTTKQEIVIPPYYRYSNTVSYPVVAIANRAFYDNENIATCAIPSTVETIGDYAFYSCPILIRVDFYEGLKNIGEKVFENSFGLDNVKLPNSIESIGSRAFYNTAFYYEDDYWTGGLLYSGTTLISGYQHKSAMIDLGANNVNKPFVGECVIKGGTKTIAGSCFMGGAAHCTQLTSIVIPETVTNISASAFIEVPWTSLTFNGVVPPVLGASGLGSGKGSTSPIYVPAEAVDTYKTAEGWSDYASRIVAKP